MVYPQIRITRERERKRTHVPFIKYLQIYTCRKIDS